MGNAAEPDQPDPSPPLATAGEAQDPADVKTVLQSLSATGADLTPGSSEAANPQPANAEAAAGPLPEALGRYRVTGIQGRGGFGTVFLGEDAELGRAVAIKVPRRGASAGDLDAFLREARRLALLRHPGIVTVFDVGADGGCAFIVTEFLNGASLKTRLRETRLAWRQAAEIAAKLAGALAYAHERGVVHQDVKPANVILTEAGEPVLIDFGLALTEAEAGPPGRTISGTLRYMSPEQACGRAHRVDGRTDIYGVGVLLYRMLCGRAPFRGDVPAEVLRQIAEDEPQPPRQLPRDVPGELERVCLKAMAKRLGDRYTTAADLVDDLWGLLGGRGSLQIRPPASDGDADLPKDLPAEASARTPRSADAGTPAGPAPEAERRRITAVACGYELTSAGAADALDPEDQHEIAQSFARLCEEVVPECGGTLVEPAGGQVLACFGFPVSHEDAARRAVDFGLRLLARVSELPRFSETRGRKPAPWCVADSGTAVVRGGAGLPLSLAGNVRQVVSGLGATADSGVVTITEATHRLVAGYFECEPLGSLRVRGVSDPVAVFRVVGATAAADRLDLGVAGDLTPLVGREAEIGVLRDCWERAIEKASRVVRIVGDPGLGKSRLVREAKAFETGEGSSPPALVVEWRCSSRHRNSSWHPATEFFSRLLELGRGDPDALRLERLERHLAGLGMDAPDQASLFAVLLGIDPGGRLPATSYTPQHLREKTQELLLDWLDASSRQGPFLLAVEDLHWADPSTLEFLRLHVAESGRRPLMTVLTFRPEFDPPWRSQAHHTEIGLKRLMKRQVAAMMSERTGVDRIPGALVTQIADRTDSVPLFVEEFTRTLQESGALDRIVSRGGISELRARRHPRDASRPAHRQAGPRGKRPARRPDRGGPGPRIRLRPAPRRLRPRRVDAAERTRETAGVRACVRERAAAGCSLHVQARADPGRRLRLAGEEVPARVPPPDRGRFGVGLPGGRRVAAGSSRASPRRSRRRRAGHPVLAEGRPTRAGGLGEPRSGLSPAERTGARLHAAAVSGPRPDGTGLPPAALREPDERERVCEPGRRGTERSRALCESLGIGVPLFHVMMVIWATRFIQGRLEESTRIAAELRTLASEHEDRSELAEALWASGCSAWWSGDFAGARDTLARIHEDSLYDVQASSRHAQFTQQISGPLSLAYWGMSLWMLGSPERAWAAMERAVALAEELRHPFTLAVTVWKPGLLAQLALDGVTAEKWADSVIAISTEHAFAFWKALGLGLKGSAVSLRGRPRDAVPLLQEAIRLVKATGCEKVLQNDYGCLADAHWQVGRRDEAWEALKAAFELNDRDQERFGEAELYRLKGRFLVEGSPEEAEAALLAAIAVARRQQARFFELRPTAALARLCASQGNRSDARDTLSLCYAGFGEASDSADLLEAARLIEELATHGP